MSWRRIPHQAVLALVFGVIAIGLAVAIVRSTTSALHAADETIGYAAGELQGIRYLARVHLVLHDLMRYRAGLVNGQVSARRGPTSSPAAGASEPSVDAISAAFARIRDGSSRAGSLDEAISDELQVVRKRWLVTRSQTDISPEDVSAVIAGIQPLLTGIAGSSGLSNDPSIDGINFGDAIGRFPLSLAYGTEAASVAAVNLGAGNRDLPRRFHAARLLAQAQTAIEVGQQDADDEMSVDPVAALELTKRAAANVRDFALLKYHVTDEYVESDGRPGRPVADRVLVAQTGAFVESSFEVIDALSRDLLRVTTLRVDQARRSRSQLVDGTIGGVALEALVMLGLAWVSIVTYRNGRQRMAAERTALESQRAALEVQLTHARAQQALLNAKAQFRAVFDRAPTGMIIVDRSCKILDKNEAAEAMLHSGDGEVTALNVILDHAPIIESVFSGATDLYSQEREYFDGQNVSFWFHVSISPVHDEAGSALFAILMIRDITASKSMEAQLVFEAGHDALTGLPNRKRFLTLLQQALDDRKRTDKGVFSVVFIDFNDFKTINDSFGHQAGDKFLVDGAARLRDSVRSTDIVARIGGDEFAVMLYDTDRFEIEKSVTRLQSVVSVPVNIEGQLVASSASFGVAQAEPGYRLAAEIIRDADTAMYAAKAQGGRNYVVFDVSMRERVVRRMQLSIDIMRALEFAELELFYQPIVDLMTGKIAGCEALVRWRRSDGTLILPSEFMPLAEENGAIVEIGHWVTLTACRQMQLWNELARANRLPGFAENFVIHVNLAVPEVHHVDLLPYLRNALATTKVARNQIVLEITEGIVLNNTPHMRGTLDAITRDGFRLCIDDFGTGYSSLRYLNELPLHSFKIDRSFVSNGADSLANRSIVEMLMVLSRSLDLTVVAEGIETRTQWEMLRELGCLYGQGYLFSPPLDAAAFTMILEQDVALSLSPPPSVNQLSAPV